MPSEESPEPTGDTVSYAEAMSELERIVERLEADDPNIDEPADQVERAAQLISACRARLGMTRERIDEITNQVDDADQGHTISGE